jgi:LmbE family N-acetylglucosaminyl deacetylase
MARMKFRPWLGIIAAITLTVAAPHGEGAADASPPGFAEGGAARTWHAITKLTTIASLLQTTAHPDDEQGGMLAVASRKWGARTGLLTLNRGEAGDNAIGPELFDALGLIRTDELAAAGRWYGLDAQYFTLAADYGFSKRMDEALEQWDRPALVGDMVRAIRTFRPLVVISRWQGTERDGHGQHQAAGALTPEAVAAAADPAAYPELAREGLLPWRVLRVFVGGVREDERWHVRIETGEYDPIAGDSYANLGRHGLAMQRSQTSGRFVPAAGSVPLYYVSRAGDASLPARAESFFDGLPTGLADAYRVLGREAPREAMTELPAIAREVERARQDFRWSDPARSSPALARGLSLTRAAMDTTGDPDVRAMLKVMADQFEDALAASLGISFSAIAEPAAESGGRPERVYAPPATLDPVAPGQTIDVVTSFTARGAPGVTFDGLELSGPAAEMPPRATESVPAARNEPITRRVRVTVRPDAAATRPYFARRSIADTRYDLVDRAAVGLPWGQPSLSAVAHFRYDGVRASISTDVVRRVAQFPDGYAMQPLDVASPITIQVSPAVRVLHPSGARRFEVDVDVTSHASDAAVLSLVLPEGWTSDPATVEIPARTTHRLERFSVVTPRIGAGRWTVGTTVRIGAATYDATHETIHHAGLPDRTLVVPASMRVIAADVDVRPSTRVGYVMGIGDEVPAAIAELGARVTLLDAAALESGDLTSFDTIVTGTRAYAVRPDLRANNDRLLDWVRAGGNMVVLYNTPEFDPKAFAPYPAELPADPEEVCEEKAPVTILAPDAALLTTPNRIAPADFDGWVEQRGSKFLASWDPAYTPLIESHDRGQAPQDGGWVTAAYGRGRWTYMAYALHRQLPAGVPGAYRLLANLISGGKADRR